MEEKDLEQVVRGLLRAKKAVAFTGAGISAESGIPTFRGEGGVWDKYPPSRFGNLLGLSWEWLVNPGRVKDFIKDVLEAFLQAQPNPAHLALGRLEALRILKSVITQNIDNLHEKGGCHKVIKIHGSLDRARCSRCGALRLMGDQGLREIVQSLGIRKGRRVGFLKWLGYLLGECESCGGRMRPDIVFFYEALPMDAWSQAMAEAQSCDLMLVIGTSGIVYPAAQIPFLAKRAGAEIVEINQEVSPLSRIATYRIEGPAGETMGKLFSLLESKNFREWG